MVFSSITFLFVFMPAVLFTYYIVPGRRGKNLVLLLFSLLFYAWGEPIYVLLMIFSIFNDYFHALFVEKYKLNNQINKAKLFLLSSIVINLGLLMYFKYAGFIVQTANNLIGTNISFVDVALPIGISFYTFQTMSYTIDVYRGRVKAQKNILTLGTYVALFPQLIAGPIVRYSTIEDELVNRKETLHDFSEGLRRFIIGLAKKMLIANNVAVICDAVFDASYATPYVGTVAMWIGVLAYGIQIYFDFSGYSDMAIGLGRMFGFHFLENFNYPYISKSITDFWRRWHMSLGSWFRDYLYIPLGGNKVSTLRWTFNVFVVWFATGLWHGAAFNFILWGLYFGTILVIEKFFTTVTNIKVPTVIKHLYTIVLLLIGWAIFRSESLTALRGNLNLMFIYQETNFELFTLMIPGFYYRAIFIFIGIICSMPIIIKIKEKAPKNNILLYAYDFYLLALLILSIMTLIASDYNPFIYFRF